MNGLLSRTRDDIPITIGSFTLGDCYTLYRPRFLGQRLDGIHDATTGEAISLWRVCWGVQ